MRALRSASVLWVSCAATGSSPSAWNHFGLTQTGFTLTEAESFLLHTSDAIWQLCKGWRMLGRRLNLCCQRKLGWGKSGSKWTTPAGGSHEAGTYKEKKKQVIVCVLWGKTCTTPNRSHDPCTASIQGRLAMCVFVTFISFQVNLCVYIRSNQHESQQWSHQIPDSYQSFHRVIRPLWWDHKEELRYNSVHHLVEQNGLAHRYPWMTS